MSYKILLDKISFNLEENEKKELKDISKQIDNLNKIKYRNISRLKQLPDDLLEEYGIKTHLEMIYLKKTLEDKIKEIFNPSKNIIIDEGLVFEYSIDILKDELFVEIIYKNKSYISKKIKSFIDFLNFIRDIKQKARKYDNLKLSYYIYSENNNIIF
jgi:hypothetical protein